MFPRSLKKVKHIMLPITDRCRSHASPAKPWSSILADCHHGFRSSLGQWKADWQMKFNVVKCHYMRVTGISITNIYIYNQTWENDRSAKYLGITITDNIDWGQHISEICSKATQKILGFLRRNLAVAPRSTKSLFKAGATGLTVA